MTALYSPLFSGGPAATGTNIAGTTTTVAGQLGTGSGASGDQVFTVGTPQTTGTTQHVAATVLTLHNAGSAGTAAPQALFADGTNVLPGISFAGNPASGLYRNGNSLYFTANGTGTAALTNGGNFQITVLDIGLTNDTTIRRRAASTYQFGLDDSASPIGSTFTVAGSRGGTDTNVAGGDLTIRPGAGTGSATGSSIIFQTPTATGSGTKGQTQTTRLTVNETDGVVLPNTTFYRGFRVDGTTSIKIAGMNSSNKISIDPDEQGSVFGGTVRLKVYTVATLPAGTVGDTAYVTDATAPTYLGALTGGGAVTTPVFYNGAAWISH